MKFQQWNVVPTDENAIDRLMEAGYSYLISATLASRGITSVEDAAITMERENNLSISPFLMADMDKAVERIETAVQNDEIIAVYGDYDVDGITATVILVDYLASRGAKVLHYIPRRIEDGYGLSTDAIQSLWEKGVKLLITVDCGITGVEEVDFANRLGMDVVVTDHHECKEILPNAVAVVDPHRPDCSYPFKHLAGCGVALKVVLAMCGRNREEALFARYCTLAAIGTIADVMQMTGENRVIVSRGLDSISHSDFIGLHALLQEAGLADKEITSVQIGFVLSPRINAAGRMGAADMAADLFLSNDVEEAERMARELCALNRERQNVEQEIYSQALEMIEELPSRERNALVLSSDTWHQGVVGIVASRLSEKYSCPSFMIHLNGGVGKGSCRSWGGFNLFSALESCKDLLLGFGGHELAAGFTIDEENIPAFRQRMNEYARDYRGGEQPISSLQVDVDLTRPSRVTLAEAESLSLLEPYGAGNQRPVFCLRGAILERAQNVGQNRHLKLKLSKGSNTFEGIFFSTTAENCGCDVGTRVDAAFYLQVNEFRDNRSIQLQMVDIRPSQSLSYREEEAMLLVNRCCGNEEITSREAIRLLPSREQMVRAWRALEKAMNESQAEIYSAPFIRMISASVGGNEPFLHTVLCVRIFEERELLRIEREAEKFKIYLTSQGKKVDLEESVFMKKLHETIDKSRRGGIS